MTRTQSPWWLAALLTAIPVLLAVLLVASFPPGPRSHAATTHR